jgi:hypothetical protein
MRITTFFNNTHAVANTTQNLYFKGESKNRLKEDLQYNKEEIIKLKKQIKTNETGIKEKENLQEKLIHSLEKRLYLKDTKQIIGIKQILIGFYSFMPYRVTISAREILMKRSVWQNALKENRVVNNFIRLTGFLGLLGFVVLFNKNVKNKISNHFYLDQKKRMSSLNN